MQVIVTIIGIIIIIAAFGTLFGLTLMAFQNDDDKEDKIIVIRYKIEKD